MASGLDVEDDDGVKSQLWLSEDALTEKRVVGPPIGEQHAHPPRKADVYRVSGLPLTAQHL
jgi:hypothetical protein